MFVQIINSTNKRITRNLAIHGYRPTTLVGPNLIHGKLKVELMEPFISVDDVSDMKTLLEEPVIMTN